MSTISVVIANHNHGPFLPACLESALGQRRPPLEVVVVDDGSQDDSLEVLSRYRRRVRVVRQQNAGQAAALSRGVAATKGELVAFLDADDTWLPDKLSEVAEALRAHPSAAWLRHKLALIDEQGRPLGPTAPGFRGTGPAPTDPRYLLERVVTAPTSALVLRRTAVAAAFPLPARESFAFDADILVLARLFAARLPGCSLDRVLGHYRRHGGQRWARERDVGAMLRRELAVAAGVATALGHATDASVASEKHRAVIAALAGAPRWHRDRLLPLARGLAAALRYADVPSLAARQSGALLLAWAAPQRWLRRLERRMPLTAEQAPRRSGVPA